jgi:hypothetical protein
MISGAHLIMLLYWLAMCFGLVACGIAGLIVRDVNRLKDADSRETYVGWRIGKMERIFTEYERRFPAGRKVFWFKVAFIAAGWLLGFWLLFSFLLFGGLL